MARKTRETVAEEMLENEQLAGYDPNPEDREVETLVTPVFEKNKKSRHQVIVNRGGRGSGKCFIPSTEVVMFDGSLKLIKDIASKETNTLTELMVEEL